MQSERFDKRTMIMAMLLCTTFGHLSNYFLKADGLGGAAFQLSGFNSELDAQPLGVTNQMFHLFLILPIGIWVMALLIIWCYPIISQTTQDTRTLLEERCGKL